MTALTITPSEDDDVVTGWLQVYDEDTDLEVGGLVYVQQISPGDRKAYNDTVRTWTSNAQGVVQGSMWADGSLYRISRTGLEGEWSEEFEPTDDGDGTFNMIGVLG